MQIGIKWSRNIFPTWKWGERALCLRAQELPHSVIASAPLPALCSSQRGVVPQPRVAWIRTACTELVYTSQDSHALVFCFLFCFSITADLTALWTKAGRKIAEQQEASWLKANFIFTTGNLPTWTFSLMLFQQRPMTSETNILIAPKTAANGNWKGPLDVFDYGNVSRCTSSSPAAKPAVASIALLCSLSYVKHHYLFINKLVYK